MLSALKIVVCFLSLIQTSLSKQYRHDELLQDSLFWNMSVYEQNHKTTSIVLFACVASPCSSNKRWRENWTCGYNPSFWQQYFRLSRPNFNVNFGRKASLCNKHYMEIYNKSKNPKCQLCSQEATPQEKWKMPFTEIDTCRLNAKDIKSASEISATEWICDKCYNFHVNSATFISFRVYY